MNAGSIDAVQQMNASSDSVVTFRDHRSPNVPVSSTTIRLRVRCNIDDNARIGADSALRMPKA